MTLTKTFRLSLAMLFVGSALFAGDLPSRTVAPRPSSIQLTRKHPVARPAPVVLTGRVYDSTRSDPVIGAKVTVGTKSTTTDDQGHYTLSGIDGGKVTLTASRWGYQDVDLDLQLHPGSNSTNIPMVSLPEILVNTSSGTSRLDFDSTKFGYLLAFLGAIMNPQLNVCTPDGTNRTLEKSEIARIDGPAVRVAGGPCCTPGRTAEQIHILLKSSESFDAVVLESCSGYTINVAGLDKVTLGSNYIPLKDMTSIVFP